MSVNCSVTGHIGLLQVAMFAVHLDKARLGACDFEMIIASIALEHCCKCDTVK